MHPSTSSAAGRDPWSDGVHAGQADRFPTGPGSPAGTDPRGRRPASDPQEDNPGGSTAGSTGGSTDGKSGGPAGKEGEVPVRPALSLAVAGFAALLGLGLIFAAQTTGPGSARIPFSIVVFGVQVLFVLAWAMAMRPPALWAVVGVGLVAAGAADVAAVVSDVAGLAPLGYVAAVGFGAAVVGQLVRPADRRRVTDSLGATLLIVVGVVAVATLIVLSRVTLGTQAAFICLTATAVALVVARLMDAVLARPRVAPQVPRGAAGVVLGAMLGTLAATVLAAFLVGFTPTDGAVVGFVAASMAVLADLAVGYAEASRQMAGEAPTMWVARHMQGPLGGFALAAPLAYAVSVFMI